MKKKKWIRPSIKEENVSSVTMNDGCGKTNGTCWNEEGSTEGGVTCFDS